MLHLNYSFLMTSNMNFEVHKKHWIFHDYFSWAFMLLYQQRDENYMN